MAKQTSRELVLERRKALSQGGKNASINRSTPNRVRSSVDARSTRTDQTFVKPQKTLSRETFTSSGADNNSTRISAHRKIKPVGQTSRQLVLARREALSQRGKTADTSKDRTRVETQKATSNSDSHSPTPKSEHCCTECEEKALQESYESSVTSSHSLTKRSKIRSSSGDHRSPIKRKVMSNPSRAIVLARREAFSKHGKSAGKQPTTAASVARQGNPDLTTKEIAQRVRELKSKNGATGKQRSGGTRPCGPNRNGAKQSLGAVDAYWKVGQSKTSSDQIVTGTQANRSQKTTGNEASTCRSITGTQYLGSEVFDTFCQVTPSASQPSKVALTNTSHGNKVTGNEVGRSDKVTGNEPGTCKNLTGTEYVSANQSNAYCGGANSSPRKVGQSLTHDGRRVTGVMVGRSSQVTGNESGSSRNLTGDQYIGSEPLPNTGRSAEKVGSLNTLRGSSVTGTNVARSEWVTGNEPGSCKRVTGDEYVGAQQFDTFCGTRPNAEAPKVGLSLTNKAQSVSGTMTGRSDLVTGDEPGTCKAVTGTPYAGLDQAANRCDDRSIDNIQNRTPRRIGTPGSPLTGLQPGIGGVMTGAHKGACENLTGTPYVGSDQFRQACANNSVAGAIDSNKPTGEEPWTKFSVQSPAKAAQSEREVLSGVTGTSYEKGSKITGPFDMAPDKITGTEQFRFDRKRAEPLDHSPKVNPDLDQEKARILSRITGEGQSSGLNITGDDWDRGDRVTGTEGASARRRNPSRMGRRGAMPMPEVKRNDEIATPDFLITGSSGNTQQGQLVTFSGGARG